MGISGALHRAANATTKGRFDPVIRAQIKHVKAEHADALRAVLADDLITAWMDGMTLHLVLRPDSPNFDGPAGAAKRVQALLEVIGAPGRVETWQPANPQLTLWKQLGKGGTTTRYRASTTAYGPGGWRPVGSFDREEFLLLGSGIMASFLAFLGMQQASGGSRTGGFWGWLAFTGLVLAGMTVLQLRRPQVLVTEPWPRRMAPPLFLAAMAALAAFVGFQQKQHLSLGRFAMLIGGCAVYLAICWAMVQFVPRGWGRRVQSLVGFGLLAATGQLGLDLMTRAYLAGAEVPAPSVSVDRLGLLWDLLPATWGSLVMAAVIPIGIYCFWKSGPVIGLAEGMLLVLLGLVSIPLAFASAATSLGQSVLSDGPSAANANAHWGCVRKDSTQKWQGPIMIVGSDPRAGDRVERVLPPMHQHIPALVSESWDFLPLDVERVTCP